MSQQDQDRADFEAWHLKTRGHVNADNVCRKWLQEKDWETWRAARSNQPLVAELLEALQELSRYAPGEYVNDARSDYEIDAGYEAAHEKARAAIIKATGVAT